jgi:hypothetical protein
MAVSQKMNSKNKFVNLPDGGQLWKRGSKWYFAYRVPGRRTPMLWLFNDKQLKALIKGRPRADRVFKSQKALSRMGGVYWGHVDQIRNTGKHPFQEFMDNYKKEARINPMLRNGEVLAVFAQALLEGREAPTDAELMTTKWWRSRNAEQRAWSLLAARDPKEADKRQRSNVLEVRDRLVEMGYEGNAMPLARKFGSMLTRGDLSEEQLESKIEAAVDPFARGASEFAGRYLPAGGEFVQHKSTKKYYYRYDGHDYALYGEMKDFYLPTADQITKTAGIKTRKKEDGNPHTLRSILSQPFDGPSRLGGYEEINDLVNEWLGPKLAKGWSTRDKELWAHRMRETADGGEGAKDQLIDELKRQRLALLPEYDKELTYEQIAQPWRAVVGDVWGERLKETDPLFFKILKMNDMAGAEQVLRREGLKRNNSKVQQDAVNGLREAFGGQVTGVM